MDWIEKHLNQADSRSRYLFVTLLMAFVYYLSARLGLFLSFENTNVSPVWPPTGFAIAVVLIGGRRYLPAILVGAFFANWQSFNTNQIPIFKALSASLLIGIGNTLEAFVASVLILRFVDRKKVFATMRGAFVFIFFGALIATNVSAFIGTMSLFGVGIIPFEKIKTVLSTWWLGDAVGALVFTPIIVLLSDLKSFSIEKKKYAELAGQVLVLLIIVFLTYMQPAGNRHYQYPLELLIIPVLLWPALRLHRYQAYISVFIVSMIAVLMTVNKAGPYSGSNLNSELLALQAFLGVVSITVLVFSAVSAERIEAVKLFQTSSQNLEKAVQRRTEELINAVESKNSFLSTMSHEIRTPLNTIIGTADLLNESNLEKEDRTYVDVMRRSSNHLLNLINNILDLASLEAGMINLNVHPFELKKIVSDIVNDQKISSNKKNVVISYKIEKGLEGKFESDPSRIEQILLNLINNAMKFTLEGSIHVDVTCAEVRGNNKLVQFSVIDTGIGIEEDAQKKIFNPFTQVDSKENRRFQGSGLGLAICERIVESLAGTIWLESTLGKGSTFHFTALFKEVSSVEVI